MNRAFSKILIFVIFVVLVGGGIFAWQYFKTPKKEVEVPEEEARVPVVKHFGGATLLIEECGDKNYITQEADYIIEGFVEKSESKWEEVEGGRRIFTYTDLTIENYLKGTPFKNNKLQIITEGGTAEGITEWVEEQPIFRQGKRVRIYFQERNGEFSIICGSFGVETIEDETANWKTYKNEEYGFEIKYSEDWEKSVSIPLRKVSWESSQETLEKRIIEISVLENPEGYSIPILLLGRPGTCEYEKIGDLTFCKLLYQFEAIQTISYATSKNNKVYAIGLTISGGEQRMDYYLPESEFQYELNIFHQMLSTFRFLE